MGQVLVDAPSKQLDLVGRKQAAQHHGTVSGVGGAGRCIGKCCGGAAFRTRWAHGVGPWKRTSDVVGLDHPATALGRVEGGANRVRGGGVYKALAPGPSLRLPLRLEGCAAGRHGVLCRGAGGGRLFGPAC